MRSFTSASTSTSCIWASEAASKFPNRPGASQESRQKPPVSPKAQARPFLKAFGSYFSRRMPSSVRKPSTGSVTCRTTSAMDTVRNLLYRGKYLKQKAVKGIKWLPTAMRTARTVAAIIHHLFRPLYRNRPSTKRNTVMAPIYIGPAVKGWGPQYIGRLLAVSLRFFCPARLSSWMVADLSGFTAPADDPPLKLGIIRLGSSCQP